MNKLNLIHDYYVYCDVLHQKWLDKTLQYEDIFKEIFQVDYSPEPYFVLKNGSIIDSGSHNSLIKSSSEYKSLYEKQLK